MSVRGECRVVMAHDNNSKQGCTNDGGAPDRVLVVAAFPVVRVNLVRVGINNEWS